MSFKLAVFRSSVSQLIFDDMPRFSASDPEFCRVLRAVKKNGQYHRIPVSIFGEVVGEFHQLQALIKSGFKTVEVIRLSDTPVKSEIDNAVKASKKIPIRAQSVKGDVEDALKMLKLGIRPPLDGLTYLKPLVEFLRYETL